MDRRKAMHTAYVITNKRCIVYSGRVFSPSVESYPIARAHAANGVLDLGGDAGDLVFRSVTTITTRTTPRGTSTSVSTAYCGFPAFAKSTASNAHPSNAPTDNDDDDDEEDEKPKKKKKKKTRGDDDDD